VVGPQAKREAGRVVREEVGFSERHACGLIGMQRGSWRYRRRDRNEAALRASLRELAGERPRFGYRRLWVFLRWERTSSSAFLLNAHVAQQRLVNPEKSRLELTFSTESDGF
jgi:hypothetical protein